MELENIHKVYVVHRCLNCFSKFAVEMLKTNNELMYSVISDIKCPKCKCGGVNSYAHPPIEQFEKYYNKIYSSTRKMPEFNDLIKCEYCNTENYELNIKCRACGAPIKHIVSNT